MPDRQKLSELKEQLEKQGVALKRGDSHYVHFAKVKMGGQRTLFQVSVDDLFDADGNRFEDDLP